MTILKNNDTWTHAIARAAIRPLIGTGVTPNHITTLRLLTGVAACVLLALGSRGGAVWGGVMWVLSAFLDRADGELARVGDMMSPGGHRYDYMTDNAINALFFPAIGLGLRHGVLFGHPFGQGWLPAAPALGVLAGAMMLLCGWLSERYEERAAPGTRTWEGGWGFHPDDALYLLGPAAWLGWLAPILTAAAVATTLVAAVIFVRLLLLVRRNRVRAEAKEELRA